MIDGDEKLNKFSELPVIFKRNKRTKGAYSKRKAIFAYINQHDGMDSVDKYKDFSPLQIYERFIKKVRPQTQ